MATHIERGESLFIPFRNGVSISDSQCRPRMYKSVANFEKSFPKHNHGTIGIEMVEYVEVKHGEWKHECLECSVCKRNISEIYDADSYMAYGIEDELKYCPYCGAKMDGGKRE